MVTKGDRVVSLEGEEEESVGPMQEDLWKAVMSMHHRFFLCESEIYGGFPDTSRVGNGSARSE